MTPKNAKPAAKAESSKPIDPPTKVNIMNMPPVKRATGVFCAGLSPSTPDVPVGKVTSPPQDDGVKTTRMIAFHGRITDGPRMQVLGNLMATLSKLCDAGILSATWTEDKEAQVVGFKFRDCTTISPLHTDNSFGSTGGAK
jgi:hypothetical protein